MIVLDTNVISDSTNKAPSARVMAWLDAQTIETLYLSAITVGELRYGIAAMPHGRRHDEHVDWLENYTLPAFSGRILPYDLTATVEYARLMSTARAAGLAIGTAGGMIAATAAAAGFTVATRDTSRSRPPECPLSTHGNRPRLQEFSGVGVSPGLANLSALP